MQNWFFLNFPVQKYQKVSAINAWKCPQFITQNSVKKLRNLSQCPFNSQALTTENVQVFKTVFRAVMLPLSSDGCHLNHSKLYTCRYPQTAVIWTVQSCYVAVILRLLSFEPFKAVNLPLSSDSCHKNCSKLLACRYPQMAVIWTVQSCYVAIILRWLSFEPFRTVISPLSSDGCHLNRSKLLSCRYPKIAVIWTIQSLPLPTENLL